MKRLFIWLSLILLGCCVMVRPMRDDSQGLVSHLSDSTVAFVTNQRTDDQTYRTFCGGVWISRTHILTARHCIPPSNPALETFDDAGIMVDLTNVDVEYSTHEDYKDLSTNPKSVARRGRTIAVDDYQDLALVQADVSNLPEHRVAVISRDAPQDGDSIHIVGHTMGMSWTYLHGYVSATRSPIFDVMGNATKALQIASPAYRGNSGGGAFNERGELVGISSWISLESPEMGFFIHRDELIAFVTRSLSE